ncbi:hypothetical protein SADUNF_Sadunf05G0114100 [Salix dunnii]|uniref:EF-hand domain-containing protein n=1 Tax=Salix dunnii TaxID=1413687 RepID=A0A835K5R3_9ROSI|nr:hypothetical protein SADUNF_Sadunf05G0114100 [Salix dunnii]
MASTSSGGRGSSYGGSAPYRSREGLVTRAAASSDEIQLRIDPIHGDLDDEITGLRSQVRQLRNVAQEIESEAKYQKDFLETLVKEMVDEVPSLRNSTLSISVEELHKVMASLGEPCSMAECRKIISGVAGDGMIDFEEFKVMTTTVARWDSTNTLKRIGD